MSHVKIDAMLNKLLSLRFLDQRKLMLIIFLIILIVLGANLYRDYGVAVDGPVERMNGIVSLKYVAELFQIKSLLNSQVISEAKDLNLSTYMDKDYPVLFNMPTALLEHLSSIDDMQQIFFLRHGINFLICLLGVYAIFRLAERRYSSWRIGLLAALIFVVTPRIFPELFYNSKDLIFLTFFVLGANSLVAFVLQPAKSNAIIHAFITALAINVRIMGVLLIVLTIGLLAVETLRTKRKLKDIIFLLAIYLLLTCILTVTFWPWLWSHPLEHIIEGFRNMAHFRQAMPVWYMGMPSIVSNNIPWHYIPLWILVSTPIFYLVLFVFGFICSINTVVRSKIFFWKNEKDLQDLIFLGLFLTPIILVVSLNSVLYNAWRQLFFIYPFFVLVATRGWVAIYTTQILLLSPSLHYAFRKLYLLLTVGMILIIALWMVRVHPFQNVFLNDAAGKVWREDNAADYWGLVNRHLLEYIAKNEERPYVSVSGSFFLDPDTQLNKSDRAKILRANSAEEADYLINEIRPGFEVVHEKRVDGQIIGFVSKRILNQATSEPLVLGQVISFSKNQWGTTYLMGVGKQVLIGSGWAYPEDWGVWIDGEKAKIVLPMPLPKPHMMLFSARAFRGNKSRANTVDIYINRQFAQSVDFGNEPENSFRIDLTSKMLEYNFLEIEFKPRGVVQSPKAMGLGDDDRKLSLGLTTLVLQ